MKDIKGGEYYEKYGEQDEYDPDELGFPMYKLTSEKYSLDNIQNMPYHQEYHCIEGLRMLYYPIDNSFFNFYYLCYFQYC